MNAKNIVLSDFEVQNISGNIFYEDKSTNGHIMPLYHWHPHYEIMVVLSGRYTLCNNQKIIQNDQPAVLINCPYTLHRMNADCDRKYIRRILYVKSEIVRRFTVDSLDTSVLGGSTLIYAYPKPDELDEILTLVTMAARHRADDKLCPLLIAAIFRLTIQIISDMRGEITSCAFTYIPDVIRFISDNLSQVYTSKQLSEKYSVGRSKFHTDFKISTGSTYKKYLTDLRQTRARELLFSGSSIINASLEVGYSSEAHFIKAFREYWGMTPGEYKQSLNGKQSV